MAQPELKVLQKELTDLLAARYIEPSWSPFGAPILFVKKKDGRLRMCIDYRALNKVTVKNQYALPRIDELLYQIFKAKVFSLIDLTQGFHQALIEEGDEEKTIFWTQFGHYQFQVMPFGMTNISATFQNLMNDILRPLLNVCVLIYIDNILIYSETIELYNAHLRSILTLL